MIVKDWDDGCRFDIYDVIDTTCGALASGKIMTVEKDQGTAQDNYICTNNVGFPDGFNFIYNCD